jgi:protein involved in polysaccharide export with SLBB domain
MIQRALLLLALLGMTGCTTLLPPPEEAEPPPFDFRLGPGDKVKISVWGEKELHQELVLGPDGSVAFPLIGDVTLTGLTLNETRVELAKRLRAGYVDPVVSVALVEMHSHVIHVTGEVARPGSVPYVRGATALGAILAAGGFLSATADIEQVHVVRSRLSDPATYGLDVKAVLEGRHFDMWLLPGDVVYVPPRLLARWDRWWRQASPWGDPVDKIGDDR